MELSNLVYSIDSTLEKCEFYKDSKFDDFIDAVNERLKLIENTNILKELPKETIFIIDRFESNYAVCENQTNLKMYNIPKSIVDPAAKEGERVKRCGDIYLVSPLSK